MARPFAPAAALAAALTLACGGGSKPTPEPVSAAPGSAGPAAGAAPAAPGAGEFGVRECDEYVRKYLACIDSKVPENARAMVRQSFDQTRDNWRRAAATPEGRATLASACTQMDASSRPAMQAYGCSW